MIYIESFMKTVLFISNSIRSIYRRENPIPQDIESGKGIQEILRYCLRKFRGSNFGVTDL
jgi:hypothetical protein